MAETIETAGEVLSNGSAIELVRDPNHPQGVALLFWDGAHASVQAQVEYEGRVFAPPSHRIVNAMRLPAGVKSCPPAHDLALKMGAFIRQFADLSSEGFFQVLLFVFSAWFANQLTVAPYLSIVGPPGSGKTRLLQVLSYLCPRAVTFSGLTSSSLCAIPMRLRPTLLMDEVDITGSLNHLLRAGTTRGSYIYHHNQPIDLYCPKVIVTQEPLPDPALAARAVQVNMVPTLKPLPELSEPIGKRVEEEVLPQLLMFYLQNHAKVQTPKLDLSCLSPHKQDVARSLAASVCSDPELQAIVVEVLRVQDEDARHERSLTPETASLLGLIYFSGQPWNQAVLCGQIAYVTNRELKLRGERLQLNAKRVGTILNKKFGLPTQKIGSSGRGIWLTGDVLDKIQRLGHYYGLLAHLQNPVSTAAKTEEKGPKPAAALKFAPKRYGRPGRGGRGHRERHERRK